MKRSEKHPNQNSRYVKRGLICGAAAGLTTVGMAAAAAMILYPAAMTAEDTHAAHTSKTPALVAAPAVSLQDDFTHHEHLSVNKKTVQTKAAIVNFDEGVYVDGVKIKYSDQILRLPAEGDYEFVSFSEARAGLKNGSFGAVIQIPASFSESVESINRIPNPCILKYEISDLAGDSQRYTLFKMVSDFEMTLSNDMSFLYISSLMTAYHEAQDQAAVVMANDRADFEALTAIEYADLVSLVEVKSFTSEELSAELPELENFSSTQNALSDALAQRFDETVSNVMDAFDQVFDQASVLGEDTQRAADAVPQPLKDQRIDDSEAIAAVSTFVMTQLTDEIEEKKQHGTEDQAAMEEMIIRYGEVLNESIIHQNAKHHKIWNETLEMLTDQYKENLPKLAYEVDEAGVTFYYESEQEETSTPVIRISLQEADGTDGDDLLARQRALQSDLMYCLAMHEGDPEALTDETLAAFQEIYAQELNDCGFVSAAELLMADLYGSFSSCADHLLIEGDAEEMHAYVLDGTFDEKCLAYAMENYAPFEDTAFSSIAPEMNDLSNEITLSGELEKIQKTVNDQSAMRISDLDEIVSKMDVSVNGNTSEIIRKMLTQKADAALADAAKQANDVIDDTSRIIETLAEDTQSFHREVSSIAGSAAAANYQGVSYSMAMNQNYSELLAACLSYTEDVRNYAYNLNHSAQQYGLAVEKDVEKIKSDTDQLLFEGLDEVKQQKIRTYDENQKILSDFVNSLYYTRLGSRENSSLYRYAADPVIIEDVQSNERK